MQLRTGFLLKSHINDMNVLSKVRLEPHSNRDPDLELAYRILVDCGKHEEQNIVSIGRNSSRFKTHG